MNRRGNQRPDLICISHLRWDFVWQRPQQLLSRLAHHYRVLFVEEPVTNTNIDKPYLETYPGHTPGARPVTIARLHYPSTEHYWIGHNDPRTQQDGERLLLNYIVNNFQQEGFMRYANRPAVNDKPNSLDGNARRSLG